jgi:hypothetical protein
LRFGLHVVAVLLSDDTEKMQCLWMIGFYAQDLAVARICLGEIAGLMVGQALRKSLADLVDIFRRSFGGER